MSTTVVDLRQQLTRREARNLRMLQRDLQEAEAEIERLRAEVQARDHRIVELQTDIAWMRRYHPEAAKAAGRLVTERMKA